MKKILLIILFLLISVSTPTQSQTEKPLQVVEAEKSIRSGNYAIIVGVNDYWSEDISDLKYCENDAKRFAATLEAQGWDSSKVRLLTGSEASFEKITDAVYNLSKLTTISKGSTIIFFFSGHGVSVEGKNYVVPYDGSAKASMVTMRNLDLTSIETALEKSPFDRKIMFLDACRNEFSTENKAVGAVGFSNLAAHKGLKVILSTQEGEYSREDTNLQSGVFTHFLIDGLTNPGADTDKDGVVVINELEVYIAKKMDEYSFKTGKDQHVMTRGESSPLIPVAVVGKTGSVEVSIPSLQAVSPPASKPIKKTGTIKDVKELRMLSGHTEPVNSVAFSLDGSKLVSGSDDKTIKIWSVSDGREIRTLRGHSNWITSVAFSPDGNTIASGCIDSTIKIWSVSDAHEIMTLSGHSDLVNSVAFSPDGLVLGSASIDSTVKIWSMSDGSQLMSLRGHSNIVTSVAFSPDGNTLASGSWDNTVKIWSLGSGQEIRTLSGHSKYVSSVAFSPDGSRLASGSYDKTVRIWSVSDGREIRTLSGHSDIVNSVVFSPDGNALASGSWDNLILIWSLDDGREIKALNPNSLVHSVAFSPDGSMLASGHMDKTVKLWSVEYE